MATTTYGVNHPLARKAWSKTLFKEVYGETYLRRFMGEGDSSLLQVKSDLVKDKGDRIRVGLRMLMTGAGVLGDDTAEGNEEALTTYNDDVFIDQLRHQTRTNGRMSEQRVPFDLRLESKNALKDWWIERLETAFANQLTGNTGQSDTRFTGNQATVAPSSGRIIVGGGETGEASLSATTTHAIKLSDLDKAVAKAKVDSPRIRPIRVDGKPMWVAFLHPYQIYQLRRDASTAGNFYDVQKAILQGGKISDNPIITGASFVYNNVIVHEWSYLPNTVSAPVAQTNYRRGVFCGAQAAMIAFGKEGGNKEMYWFEEMFDYGNQFGVSGGLIYGIKKSVFNSIDFGTIVLSGYAPSP